MAATIDIPGLGKKRFQDVDEFRSWLHDEKEHYKWARDRFRNNEVLRVRDHWWQQNGSRWLRVVDQTLKETEEFNGQKWSDDVKDIAENKLHSGVENTPALWSETAAAQYIESLRTSHDDVCALAALIYLTDTDLSPPQVPLKTFWDGWLFAFLYAYGLQKKVPRHYKAINTLVKEFRTELEDINETVQSRIDKSSEELQQLEEHRRWFAARARAQAKGLRRLRDAFRRIAHDEIEEQRRKISDHIAMHSSVDYWSRKADGFGTEEKQWGKKYYWSLALGTGLLLIAVVAFFVVPSKFLTDFADRLSVLGDFYLMPIGAVVIVIGMWLWVTRMFGRLYLESRSRKEEAEHRVTMIRAYLAMLTDEKAFEKDGARELILPAIFGPPSSQSADAEGPPVSIDRIGRLFGLR